MECSFDIFLGGKGILLWQVFKGTLREELPVAIKVLNEQCSGTVQPNSFLKEIAVMCSCHEPNMVKVTVE